MRNLPHLDSLWRKSAANWRGSGCVDPLATSAELGPVHMAGDLTTLTVGQTTLRLTRVEFAILRLLLVRYGHAVSRETTAKFIGSAGTAVGAGAY